MVQVLHAYKLCVNASLHAFNLNLANVKYMTLKLWPHTSLSKVAIL